jgi:hypothetical protein
MSSRKMPVSLDLVRGDVLLGSIEIKPEAADFPWQAGAFRPSSAFEEVRALFAQELALLKANEADDSAQWDDWEEIYETLVEPGLRLRAADGAFLEGDLLIHIDGTDAWWRTE